MTALSPTGIFVGIGCLIGGLIILYYAWKETNSQMKWGLVALGSFVVLMGILLFALG